MNPGNDREFYVWVAGFMMLALGLTSGIHHLTAVTRMNDLNKPDAGVVEVDAEVVDPMIAPRCRCGADE